MPDAATTAWFAGLFEGEGCISVNRSGGANGRGGGVTLTIRMTDRDVIERVNAVFPCPGIKVTSPPVAHWKPQYSWRISNPKMVRSILELSLPWFGERRAAKAAEAIDHLDTRPGLGWRGRLTHCKRGHEFTPENTYRYPNGQRGCRTCRRAHDKGLLSPGLQCVVGGDAMDADENCLSKTRR